MRINVVQQLARSARRQWTIEPHPSNCCLTTAFDYAFHPAASAVTSDVVDIVDIVVFIVAGYFVLSRFANPDDGVVYPFSNYTRSNTHVFRKGEAMTSTNAMNKRTVGRLSHGNPLFTLVTADLAMVRSKWIVRSVDLTHPSQL